MDPFVVNDFSGGITDGYLKAPPSRNYVLDNLWLDENMKPYTRPGMVCYEERAPTSTTNTRITGVYLDTAPYGLPVVVRTNKIYVGADPSAPAWTEVTGPSLNPALPNKGNTDLESAAFWNKQIVFASEGTGFNPHRLLCTAASGSTGTFLSIQLGLPSFTVPQLTYSGGSNNYIYAFHWHHIFQDADQTVYEQDVHAYRRDESERKRNAHWL